MADSLANVSDNAPPVLTEKWVYSPAITGDPRYVPPSTHLRGPGIGPAQNPNQTDTGDKPTHTPPLKPPGTDPFFISPGGLETAADSILYKADAATDTYTDLRDYITANKSWMFSVQNQGQITDLQYLPVFDNPTDVVPESPYDPHPDWTHDLSVANDRLLLSVADAIYLAGQYLDMLNNAGQFYAQADDNSRLPSMQFNSSQRLQ